MNRTAQRVMCLAPECECETADECLRAAEDQFLAASVEVWREIDRLTAYGGGSYPGIPMSTDLRQREREAWERYREVLDGLEFSSGMRAAQQAQQETQSGEWDQ